MAPNAPQDQLGKAAPEHTVDFQDVRLAESPAIWRRRNAKPPAADALPNDLVGLALSGGGIRAASVGLGVLQALHESDPNRVKEIDYLSTVSGGGYIGAYLSTAAMAEKVDSAIGSKNSDAAKDGYGQPLLVQRFIFGGKYLNRPWEAANKYLIGLFFNNLLLLSGLIMLGALFAFIWRLLDFDWAREWLDVFGLNSGVTTALLPFYIFLILWLATWVYSYWWHQGDAPGKSAQRLLYCTIVSFFVGVTVLLVNSETKLGSLSVILGESKLENSGTLTKWLLGLLAASLTPLLAPTKLLRFGLNPQNIWEWTIFRIAMFALLVGVPMSVVGLIALPNISDTATDAHDNLRAGDIRNWPAFVATLNNIADWQSNPRKLLRMLSDHPTPGVQNAEEVMKLIASPSLKRELAPLRNSIQDLIELETQPEPTIPQRMEIRRGRRALNDQKAHVCKVFSDDFLSSYILPFMLTTSPSAVDLNKPPEEDKSKQRPSGFERLRNDLKTSHREEFDAADLNEDIADAELSYRSNLWSAKYAKSFNLTLLRALHPECFYLEGKAYRHLVINGDQASRAWIFGGASIIFALAALCVNLNSTSLHRFYRNRLKHAYFVPIEGGSNDFDLSAMDTTSKGAPYHLVNTTIDLSRSMFLDEVDAESGTVSVDRRELQTFTFSQLYCGSDATGWSCTTEYEKRRADNINFADAIALSGSAIDPIRTRSLGLNLAVWALNLNLGQWMPNPSLRRTKCKPNFFILFWHWLRRPVARSSYCYVTDGGFADNLGIMPLLRRRCRLIIAVDATCDPKCACADLNWVIRAARVRYGVEFLQPTRSGEEEAVNTSCFEPTQDGLCSRHFVVARIRYPEKGATDAWLLYLKPSFTGDEGADLLKYRIENAEFPNDSTINQFYEPARVEAYRRIGYHIAEDFCDKIKNHAKGDLLSAIAALDKEIVEEQIKIVAEAKLKQRIPAAVPKALRIGKAIVKCLEDDTDNSANKDRRTQGLLASAAALRREIRRAARAFNGRGKARNADAATKFSVGEICTVKGTYTSSCECGRSIELALVPTVEFPPCECGNASDTCTWTRKRSA